MTRDHHSSRRDRSLMGQLFVVGNLLFVLLLGGGIVSSILVEDRRPQVRYGYSDAHRRLLDTESNSTVIPRLRSAAAIDFDNAAAQLQLLSTAYALNDRENVVFALRGLLNHTPNDPLLHDSLAISLLDSGNPEEALIHSGRAVNSTHPCPGWTRHTGLSCWL